MTHSTKQARNLRSGDVVLDSTVDYVWKYKTDTGVEMVEIHFVRGTVVRVPARTRFTR
jgi:hypothetical protein